MCMSKNAIKSNIFLKWDTAVADESFYGKIPVISWSNKAFELIPVKMMEMNTERTIEKERYSACAIIAINWKIKNKSVKLKIN